MKRLLVILALPLSICLNGPSRAADNGMTGMFLGAGGGALAGQAIGRNTRGTVIGTAVGAMLGYALGNEMDKAYYGGYPPRVVYQTPVYQPTQVVMVRPESQGNCRQMEMLAYVDGRPERVLGTACWQDGQWVAVGAVRPMAPPIISRTVVFSDDDDEHEFHHEHHRDFRRPGCRRGEGPERVITFRRGW